MPESSVLLLYSVFLSDEPHKSHHDFLAAFFSTLLVKPRCYMIHHSVYIVAVTIEYVSESLHTSTCMMIPEAKSTFSFLFDSVVKYIQILWDFLLSPVALTTS